MYHDDEQSGMCGCGCDGNCEESHLSGIDDVPVVGGILDAAGTFYGWAKGLLEDFFGVFTSGGAGSREADVIVPIQNLLINPSHNGQLDQITEMLTRNPTVQGLQILHEQVRRIGQDFMNFISDDRFEDGRASEQAANTIMPYIDGSCGYRWPPPMHATQQGCLQWGDGTPGGVGSDGMAGAIRRAILLKGGILPPPLVTQGYGTAYPRLAPSGSQSYPWISQAGTLPASAPLSPLRPSEVPVISAGLGSGLLLPVLIGGAAFMLLGRRR